MKNAGKNKYQRKMSFMLLIFFLFSFMHSELGFLNFDNDDHSAHDYCELVKNVSVNSKLSQNHVPKPELKHDICYHCYTENTSNDFLTILSKPLLREEPLITNQVYLTNKILLI